MCGVVVTHDELLEAVQSESADRGGASIAALIAVVELHKPFDFRFGDEMFTSCKSCGEAEYPCPTIQAIEKELS